jgi:hypothetical protein
MDVVGMEIFNLSGYSYIPLAGIGGFPSFYLFSVWMEPHIMMRHEAEMFLRHFQQELLLIFFFFIQSPYDTTKITRGLSKQAGRVHRMFRNRYLSSSSHHFHDRCIFRSCQAIFFVRALVALRVRSGSAHQNWARDL